MKKRILSRRKVTEIIAVLLSLATMFGSVDTAFAAGESDQSGAASGENQRQNVTFVVEGDGSLVLTSSCDGAEQVVTDGTTLNLPVGTYVHMIAESAQADEAEGTQEGGANDGEQGNEVDISLQEGGIVVGVQTEDGYQAEDSVFQPEMRQVQDITVTEYAKVVTVQFQASEEMAYADTFALTARGTAERPEVGDVFSGTCNVSYVDQTHVGGSVSSVQVNGLSGVLAEIGTLTGLTCQQHSAAAPLVDMGYDYTYTVKAVNKSSGEVSGVFYARSQEQPSDGVTTVNGMLAGYQAIGGTARIVRKYTGFAKLIKRSANEALTTDNSCYSLAGAVYGIYTDNGCGNQVGVFTTDASGNTNTVELPAGTYYVREKTAPKGFCLDETVYPMEVKVEETATLTMTDEPGYMSARLVLDKMDQNAGNQAQGKATLEGAQFVVRFYEGSYQAGYLPEEPTRSWVLETKGVAAEESEESENHVVDRITDDLNEDSSDVDNIIGNIVRYECALTDEYKVEGDDFYTVNGENILPLGTISIEEVKAPKGYLLDGALVSAHVGNVEKNSTAVSISAETPYVTQVQMDGGEVFLEYGNAYDIQNRVIRGDIEFTKADEHTQKRMAEIPFRMTSVTTGESHEIMTDENGYYSSASTYVKHSERTNEGQSESGLWFGLDEAGQPVAVDDARGALPYDTYYIEELPCAGNEGKELFSGNVTITRENFLLDMGTIDNYNEEIQEPEEEPKVEKPEEKKEESKPQIVKTGDTMKVAIWIGLCIVAFIGAFLTFLYKRYRR